MRVYLSILFFLVYFSSTGQNLFDIGIRKIEIFFSEPNWDDSLDVYYANNIGERLIADSIFIDGKKDIDVGVKYKGNSSYNANNAKNPLNIKLDEIHAGQSIDGYNELKLSNGFRDPSFVREVLAYEMAREYMPASKATYANVFINGNFHGLYTCVQSVDDDFTNEHFFERKGPFFKADNTGVQVPNCPTGQNGIWKYYADTNCLQKAYEMQSSGDWTILSNFLDTVNNYFSSAEKVLDEDRTLWMMAFSNLTVTLDGPINTIPHNFYLFQDNNHIFSPIIWDLNGSFGTFTNGLPQPITTQDLQELDIFHNSNDNQNKMTSQIFSSDLYRRMYVAHMRTILNEQFANGNYLNRALQLQAIIDSSVTADPNGFYSHTEFVANINSSIGSTNSIIGITELMNDRISFVQSLPEFTATPPTITSISANPTNPIPFSLVTISAQISNATQAILGYRFNPHAVFEKVVMSNNGNGNFSVSVNLEATDLQYYIYAENNDAGIFSPERAEKEFHQIAVTDKLVINEIMATNTTSITDQNGEYDDWVELYNGNNFSINLSGYYLSDSENNLQKWSFPNVSIGANSYLIIWCDSAGNTQTGLHTTFRLSSDGEDICLTAPNGTLVNKVYFVNMPNDLAYARIPNGTGSFVLQTQTNNANNQTILNVEGTSLVADKPRIYPNPSKDKVVILGIQNELTIYNLLGQQQFYLKANGNLTIDISAWEPGIYFIETNQKVEKLIKN